MIRGNANDPHVIELTREPEPASVVNGRMAGTGIGYVRVAAIGPNTASQVKSQIAELTKGGAAKLVILRLGRSCQPMLNAPSLGKNCSSL